jgi:hypothetical protein
MDLIDIYKIFHPETKEYRFFSGARVTSSEINHILSHNESCKYTKKTGIICHILSDHNGIKL